jgi:hypothetical protein
VAVPLGAPNIQAPLRGCGPLDAEGVRIPLGRVGRPSSGGDADSAAQQDRGDDGGVLPSRRRVHQGSASPARRAARSRRGIVSVAVLSCCTGRVRDRSAIEKMLLTRRGANGARTRNPLLAKSRSHAHRAVLARRRNRHGRSRPHRASRSLLHFAAAPDEQASALPGCLVARSEGRQAGRSTPRPPHGQDASRSLRLQPDPGCTSKPVRTRLRELGVRSKQCLPRLPGGSGGRPELDQDPGSVAKNSTRIRFTRSGRSSMTIWLALGTIESCALGIDLAIRIV